MASVLNELKEKNGVSVNDSISEEFPTSIVSQSKKNTELSSNNIISTQDILKDSENSKSSEENTVNVDSIESDPIKKTDSKVADNIERISLNKENIIGSTEINSSDEILSSLEDDIMLDDSDSMEDLLDPIDEEAVGLKRKRDSDEIFSRKIEFKKLESDTDSSDEEQMSFSEAEKRIKELKKIPSDHDVILAYALHKQSVEGDNETEYPLPLDFVGKIKWETWNDLKGLSKEVARKKYINLVKHLDVDP